MSGDRSQTTLAEHQGQEDEHGSPTRQKIAATTPESMGSPNGTRLQLDVADEEKRQGDKAKNRPDAEKNFEVAWDGDDDPMNPRSMRTSRKWLIVLIVSTSSLCV